MRPSQRTLDLRSYYQTDGRFVNFTDAHLGGDTAPRAVNPHRHAARRDEFIDAGQLLIQTRGYEHFSIEDLLTEVGASKGAFYHYFGSKQVLLAAIIDRLVDAALARVAEVVDAPRLSAVEKFRGYFAMIASIKAEQREFMLQLLKVWYSDDNAIVREKLRREQIVRVTPHIAAIIRQGVAEGSFALADPEQMARVVLALILDTGDEAGEMFLARQRNEIDYETVRRRFDTYQIALERLLGVPPGELALLDEQMLRLWFDTQDTQKENS
jgi:AcrR family transcriptional regulator